VKVGGGAGTILFMEVPTGFGAILLPISHVKRWQLCAG
jgi:hypothetical protein